MDWDEVEGGSDSRVEVVGAPGGVVEQGPAEGVRVVGPALATRATQAERRRRSKQCVCHAVVVIQEPCKNSSTH